MTTRSFRKLSFQTVSKGLGQLKAYVDVEEGVAFQMDNKLIWNSLGKSHDLAIQGVAEKMETSKFWITLLPSRKVMLKDSTGMYLAPVSAGTDPNMHPLFLVPYSEDASLQFDVFYRENVIAFRAYNGLFLARVDRSFHTIEAAKTVADNSCCFRPMIGDLKVPTFQIIKVTTGDFSDVNGYTHVLKKEMFINRSNVSQLHMFSVTWEHAVEDRVVWRRLWGLGIATSCNFLIGSMGATLKYTEDNDKAVFVTRKIYERLTKEVVVPPRTKITASLMINKLDHIAVPFMATVRKVKSNGDVVDLDEPGSWRGLLYFDIYLDIATEQLSACTIM